VAREEEIEAAAMVAFAGIDPARFMATTDLLEQQVIQAVADRTLELHRVRDENLATMIANNIVAALYG
jgi:hypothetical protein